MTLIAWILFILGSVLWIIKQISPMNWVLDKSIMILWLIAAVIVGVRMLNGS